MAKADHPRLRDLVPETVGADAARLVLEHVGRLSFSLGLTWKEPELASTQIAWTVADVTRYAQHGLAPTDWPDHSCALDAIQSACEALYSQAGIPGTFGVGALEHLSDVSDSDLDDPISIVLVAAYARCQIAQGQEVGAAELAALASLTAHGVRHLARTGELRASGTKEWSVSAKEARRWLEARGIEGLGEERRVR